MPKLARHTNELLTRLERVLDVGCAEIRSQELLMWYGQERVTVGIWRDILEHWEELKEAMRISATDCPLFVGEAYGVWVFVWGEGLKGSEGSWLKDLRERAKRKPADTGNAVDANEQAATEASAALH